MPVVGVLGSAAPAVYVERLTAIRQGLAENGFTESLGALIVYPSVDRLIEALEDKIVRPAEAKFHEFLDVDHHRVRQVRFPELPQR